MSADISRANALMCCRISDLGGAGGLLADNGSGTLEEREARSMASTTALRRDLAPIIKIRIFQDTGGRMEEQVHIKLIAGFLLGAGGGYWAKQSCVGWGSYHDELGP